jgi:LysM repeat protein
VPRPRLARPHLSRHRLPIAVLLLAFVATASTSGSSLYRIKYGDTLSGIAAHYHMSLQRLVAFNHLPGSNTTIYAGAYLRIPTGAAHPSSHTSTSAGHKRTVVSTYYVKPGDTLIGVARRFRANAQRIAAYSHLRNTSMIYVGQRLRIPRDVRVGTVATPQRGGAYQRSGPSPSRETVAAVLRATAQRWHIDPRLVLAIGWQESGFNQRWVSSTGAVGAMQVEPYTGEFVSKYVVRRPLNLYQISDNATAGVALLSVLLRETHGNAALAVAGYYQGLASVQSRGMYSDTKRYVANVLALRNRF